MKYERVRELLHSRLFQSDLARAEDGTLVEVRRFHPWVKEEPAFRNALHEEHLLLASLEDPRLPRVVEVMDEQTVLAYAPCVDLSAIFDVATGGVALPFIASVAMEVARALAYLHERDLLHGDVRPEAIRVTHSGDVQLVDCLLAQWPQPQLSLTGGGPLFVVGYGAPELVKDMEARRTEKTDIFALGIVMYELSSGLRALDGDTILKRVLKTLQLDLLSIDRARPDLPPQWCALVKAMLALEPSARPSAAEVRKTLQKDLSWAMWTADQRANELRALLPQEVDR